MLCAFFCGSDLMAKAELAVNNFISLSLGFVFLGFVIIPLVVMLTSYLLIYIKIRKSQKRLTSLGMSAHSVHKNDVSSSKHFVRQNIKTMFLF